MSDRVLIVEDDHATQLLLKTVLERESIETDLAAGGEDALRKLDENDFGAVLLDLLMPRSNGFDVLKTLAVSRPELMKRIVVITAAADSAWAGCPEVRQVRCMLRKPLDITQLVRHIRACIAASTPAARAAL